MIKGGGGALLREKVLAQTSRRNVIIVDESELSATASERLGPCRSRWFRSRERWRSDFLKSLGAEVSPEIQRRAGRSPRTRATYFLDARFGPMPEPGLIAARLNGAGGVVEHGLFLGLARRIVAAARRRPAFETSCMMTHSKT